VECPGGRGWRPKIWKGRGLHPGGHMAMLWPVSTGSAQGPPQRGGSIPDDPPINTEALVVTPKVVIHPHALEYSFASSSGPGGQNVNKKATKCTLRVTLDELPLTGEQLARLCVLGSRYVTDDGEMVITADEHRSQPRNKGECIDKLSEIIRQCLVAPKVRRKTKPSRGSKERRLKEKKVRGDIKKKRRSDPD